MVSGNQDRSLATQISGVMLPPWSLIRQGAFQFHSQFFVTIPTMAGETILVIEDDREVSTTVQTVLKSAGYSVLSAANGQDGRNLIDSRSPDLIITDMMMPRMGGFPVLEYLQEKENSARVIMMTANEGSRHKAYAEMLGVVEYLRKPFAMEVLLEAVKRALTPDSESTVAE